MLKLAVAAALALCIAIPTRAEVVAQTANGFTITHQVEIGASPQSAYEAFVAIGTWWDMAHSYGGKASAMRLDASPGGAWVETLDGGGFVTHMTVAQAVPGSRLVLSGGLGPLGRMGVSGTMTVTFSKAPTGTRVKLDYAVGGFDPDGFAQLAKAVDGVLAGQLQRYGKMAAR
jgi:uncharacterized protein YndB with AHSA1/START domain